MKFGMNVMPLETTPTSYCWKFPRINNHTENAWTCRGGTNTSTT